MSGAVACLAGAAVLASQLGVSPASAATAPVLLGTAASYSVLGAETVTNTGPSVLDANLGVSPGSAITGFPPGVSNGETHAGDAAAAQAKLDAQAAYTSAANRPSDSAVSGDLVGQTLVAGVYTATSDLGLTGTVTFNGQGDHNSVFIVQVGSAFTTGSASVVALENGAQACNIFWQVGSTATIATSSTFVGTILASTSVVLQTGATIAGRAVALTGAVTLDTNVFTTPPCDTTPTSPTASDTSTTAPATDTPATDTAATDTAGSQAPVTGVDTTSGGTGPAAVIQQATGSTSAAALAATGMKPPARLLLLLGSLLILSGSAALLLARRPRSDAATGRHRSV